MAELSGKTTSVKRRDLFEQAESLANRLAGDLETLAEIKDRWRVDANDAYQIMRPLYDKAVTEEPYALTRAERDYVFHQVTGLHGDQGRVLAEVGQALSRGETMVTRLRNITRAVAH